MYKIWEHNKRNTQHNTKVVVDPSTRLIGMIPNTPSSCFNLNHHLQPDHVAVGSPIKRVSPPSSSSSSNPFSIDGSPSPYSAPFLNDHCFTKPWLDSESSCFDDDLKLSDHFARMNIIDGNKNMDSSYVCSFDANNNDVVPFFNETGTTPFQHFCNAGVSVPKGYTFGTPIESYDWNTNHVYHHAMEQRKKQGSQFQLQNPSFISNPFLYDPFMGSQSQSQPFGMDVKKPFTFSQSQIMHPKIALNPNANVPLPPSHCVPATNEMEMAKEAGYSQYFSQRRNGIDPASCACENSFIPQGKDMKHCIENGNKSMRCYKNGYHGEVCENNDNNTFAASDVSLRLLLNFYSLAEVHDYIYNMAKDQSGCRFLQRMVDEGTHEDMRMVFEGIIENVVELMMDPFGNYLVQKLLSVCNEDQRLQIVLMLTNEPGQLVRISLNTHGTRVVQKLIETLNSGQQISLVRSAIQPGFLDLIKDLNGNHVIQRCLQCLSCQDNEFIFDAGVKFCVDIATHRHGCCVLQRCIDHSVGKHRDKLVTEICKHGLFLAQDPFGNYVVQHIIEMEIPTASTKMNAQFKGSYVNLSTQKFSSHVVQRCLEYVADSRSRIVREFLSDPHFEQLLQDPFANYVIQTALAFTKGSLHTSLVEAVRQYKILRNSPYCKGIFSGSLLKK
ncbi:hypothetical protein TanjilG_12651 [Lupinus angustifolius]|uniref:PUM-HD domain-containing protein n=1 Tax=Lupinus angustifolius TaxID=3871 RepID=A0A4P1QZ34_LUPAN|nr:PREDICTED: putative pumilio homolog 7, chloroplastic [Lupinus angustifolius]OIV97894.1 hypothetical protein TanjilG_12651 [Lupinus angustifolius]